MKASDITWHNDRGYVYVEGYGCVRYGFDECTHQPGNHSVRNDTVMLVVRAERSQRAISQHSNRTLAAIELRIRMPYVRRGPSNQPGQLPEGSEILLHTGFKTLGRVDDGEKGQPCAILDGPCFSNDHYSCLQAQELFEKSAPWPLGNLADILTARSAEPFWQRMDDLFRAWLDRALTESAALPHTCPHCGGTGSVPQT